MGYKASEEYRGQPDTEHDDPEPQLLSFVSFSGQRKEQASPMKNTSVLLTVS